MPTAENVQTRIADAKRLAGQKGLSDTVIADVVSSVAARCAQIVVEFQPSLVAADGAVVAAANAIREGLTQQCALVIQREFGL